MAAPNLSGFLDHYLAIAAAALTPVPGKQFVLAGGEVPWDQCDCNGQVWSRIVNVQPIFGTSRANGQPCAVLRWEVTLAVGVIRCVAVPSQNGTLPTGVKMTADGHQAADDLANLMQAVLCDPLTSSVNSGQPVGPGGGCAGSEVEFLVKLNACDCEP